MTEPNAQSKKRLFSLLDKIIGEEQSFKRTSCDLTATSGGQHAQPVDSFAGQEELEQIRRAHKALFEVHRRFVNDHELIIQRCLVISRQARAGLLNETEIDLEVERLQHELKRIKAEHRQVEQECNEFLEAHREFLGDLGQEP